MKRTLLALCRFVIGGVFVWSAVSKAADLRAFADDIANYQMLPARLVPSWTVMVPGIELVAGLLVLIGFWAEAAATTIAFLLVLFIGALSQALLRGIDLRCGCFGGADVATWGTVVRDVLLLIPSVAVARWGPGRWGVSVVAQGRVGV